MIELNIELGLPLTLDPSRGRFGGMTSSLGYIPKSGVIDQNLFFIRLVNELYAVRLNRLLYHRSYRHIHKGLINCKLRLTAL